MSINHTESCGKCHSRICRCLLDRSLGITVGKVETPIDEPRDTLPTPVLTESQAQFRADLRTVLDALEKKLIEKNDAYGDSALNPIRYFAKGADASLQIKIRLDDKLSRLMRGSIVPGSDIAAEDVMEDCFGYHALYQIAELRRKRG